MTVQPTQPIGQPLEILDEAGHKDNCKLLKFEAHKLNPTL